MGEGEESERGDEDYIGSKSRHVLLSAFTSSTKEQCLARWDDMAMESARKRPGAPRFLEFMKLQDLAYEVDG